MFLSGDCRLVSSEEVGVSLGVCFRRRDRKGPPSCVRHHTAPQPTGYQLENQRIAKLLAGSCLGYEAQPTVADPAHRSRRADMGFDMEA